MIGDYTKQGLLNKLKKGSEDLHIYLNMYTYVLYCNRLYFVTSINEYEHMSIKLVMNMGRMSNDATFQINYSDASEKEKV